METTTASGILQMEIQERYITLSWLIGRLSASLSTGKGIGSTDATIKKRLVDLINLASFNPSFHDEVDKTFNKYLMTTTDPYTTLRVWKLVSESLRKNNILTLPDR